ncbi:MAG: hypothetical protein ACXVD1_09995 [Nocardioides sp.]
MAQDTPAPRRRRRTVLMTAGLSASATVMALQISLGTPSSGDDDAVAGSPYGDSAVVELDADASTTADPE